MPNNTVKKIALIAGFKNLPNDFLQAFMDFSISFVCFVAFLNGKVHDRTSPQFSGVYPVHKINGIYVPTVADSLGFYVRPSQGFWGFKEKGYFFSGIWGEGSFIFGEKA